MRKYNLISIFTILCLSALCFKSLVHSKPDLTVLGYIDMSQGLGRQSAELVKTFKDDLTVNFIGTAKKKTKKLHSLFPFLKKKNWGKVIIFEDMLWAPDIEKYKAILSADPNSIRIAYTMWESTKLPHEWVMILNEHFDAAVVPAPFLVDTYVNSGVTIPVFHLPLGLYLDSFFDQSFKEQPGDPFTFGNFSVCSERKNHLALIHAFAKAFGNDPNVRLRLNCRFGEKKVARAITKAIADLDLDNIILTQLKLTSEQYLETFKTLDCYVSPSKGEGFSIQPREAMALGIPVIVTNSTGQIPICDSGLVKAINADVKESAIFPWGNVYGHYYNCSVDELAQALTDVRDHYEAYLGKREQSRQWVQQYQYHNLRPLYRSLIKPKHVILGDKNEVGEEGLITNSLKLKEKYERILKKCQNEK